MRTVAFFLALIISNLPCLSQSAPGDDKDQIVEEAVEKISESLIETGQTELPEELTKLAANKIDINSEEIELLVAAGLLDRTHCDAIRNYILNSGRLVEPEELQQVPGFNKEIIRRIIPYAAVYTTKEIKSSTTVTLRFQQSVLQQVNYYNGSLSRLMLRVRSVVNSRITFGLTCEKDEGEEMFTKRTPAFDFNSAFIAYSGNRLVRRIIAGDYNLEFGQGLTMWSGLSFGGLSAVTSLFKSGRGIVPYTGTDENRFFRGAAISLRKNKFQLDCWASHHAVDANIYTDTITGTSSVTSLQFSGYHRSYGEQMDFHSQKETSAGMHVKYQFKSGEAGLISSLQYFSVPITGTGKPYTNFSFRGDRIMNNGFYYSFTYRNFIIFGEESFSDLREPATLNAIIASIDPKFSLGLLHRHYPKNFINYKSNAIGVNSSNSNEDGIRFTLNFSPKRQFTFSSEFDLYSFPFLKYKVDGPSKGSDITHLLEFKPNKKFNSQIRYRVRKKQENISSENYSIGEYAYESIRVAFVVKIDNDWSYGMRYERLGSKLNDASNGNGTMLSQDLFYKPMGKKYSLNFRYAVFHCSEFETRIYAYENDVPGSFSVPFYYGDGCRFYLNLNLRLGRRLTLSTRFSKTWQENSVDFDEKSDVKIQLRVAI